MNATENAIKTFAAIEFDPQWHSYTLNDQKLISATRYINQHYKKPFDRAGISARVAERDGKTVGQVLAEWDEKGRASREKGTRVHNHIEKTIRGELEADGTFLNLNNLLPEERAFHDLWSELARAAIIYKGFIEWVIGDTDMGIAGTVDAVFFSPQSEQWHIWDWKTGSFDLENRFENLLPPFDNLSASKYHIYSLQVSLYRLILEINTDLEMGDSYLCHLAADGSYQVHKALDLVEDLDTDILQAAYPF